VALGTLTLFLSHGNVLALGAFARNLVELGDDVVERAWWITVARCFGATAVRTLAGFIIGLHSK
jgi:hypothetical protein